MTEFNKFLAKYNMHIIAAQTILLCLAVFNTTYLENGWHQCEVKAGWKDTYTPPTSLK